MATRNQSQISTLDDVPEVVAETSSADVQVLTGANANSNLSGKMEIVTVYSSEGDAGSEAVFLSHDGYAYQFPRDQPYRLPTEVAQILRDAKVTSYMPGPDGAFVERHRNRYAFDAKPA